MASVSGNRSIKILTHYGRKLALRVTCNMISTRTRSKFLLLFKKTTNTVSHMSLNHKVLSSPLFLLNQDLKLAVFGLRSNRVCRKTFSTFQLNILTTLLLQGKISANGPSLNHLHALSASRLNLSNTLSLAASHILKMVVTLGAIIKFFSILQKHFLHFQTALYIPIFHLLYLQA